MKFMRLDCLWKKLNLNADWAHAREKFIGIDLVCVKMFRFDIDSAMKRRQKC